MTADPTKVNLSVRPELFDFHGVSMTHYFTDNWEKIQNFQARPDDILIATYPKAGTTWVSYILDLLHFGQTAPERQTSIPIDHRVPFMEIYIPSVISGVEQAINLPTSPRLIKTHFPVQFVPKSFWEQKCKMIYVARNAKDNVVSYFHFDRMTSVEPEPGDWSSYLQRFMKGKMVFGSWYDHVSGWWKKKQTYSNIHYMFFEDMIEDTGREIDNLCSFLSLSPSVEEKQRITGGVQFDKMKKNDMTNYSTFKGMDFKVSPFMRKGKVGDWKNHFTVAQNEEFDEDYKRQMKDPTLKFRSVVNLPPRPNLFDFHGVSMTHYLTDTWEKVQNFQARPDDIPVVTYPKAGYDMVMNLTTSPRLIKTHFPVQFMPKSFWEQNCKMIYVGRNAKDNAVSFYHFDRMNMAEPEPGEWSSYLQRFMEGKVIYGSWFDHVNRWWKKKQTYSNIHYMFYEDMIEDTRREIDKLCSFLGLSPSVKERQRITAGVQFDNMKNDVANKQSTMKFMDFKVSPFMRKGKVGDWKNHFIVAQNEKFDEDYERHMKDPTLKFRTVV
ncbi:uncharacterized protein V6R79_000245 [Siganus canaliculatus]